MLIGGLMYKGIVAYCHETTYVNITKKNLECGWDSEVEILKLGFGQDSESEFWPGVMWPINSYFCESTQTHCSYHRYLYHQGNELTTGGTIEAVAKPWLISNMPNQPFHLILQWLECPNLESDMALALFINNRHNKHIHGWGVPHTLHQ